jgi:glycosyltransferase involved in cell wall biosynthesis
MFGDVVVSSESQRQLVHAPAARVRVVPNTIEGPDAPHGVAADETLLFVGNLQYDANLDAIRHLVDDILPAVLRHRSRARLVVAGRTPGVEARALARGPATELVGDPPTLDPVYRAARVVVAPMRLGGGTRIKVLEAMANGRPMVLTPEAADGLDLGHGREAFIEATAAGFARRCVELLADRPRAAEMGDAGRRTWETHHRPEVAMDRIEEIISGPRSPA